MSEEKKALVNQIQKMKLMPSQPEETKHVILILLPSIRNQMMMVSKISQENSQLINKEASLQEKVCDQKKELEQANEDLKVFMRNIRMLNNGTKNLDEILNSRQTMKVRHGLGYSRQNSEEIEFVKTKEEPEQKEDIQKNVLNVEKNVHPPSLPHKKIFNRNNSNVAFYNTSDRRKIICHYCEVAGHIRPHCKDYLRDLKKMRRRKFNNLSENILG
ncbi:hypothetical protein C2S52_014048 [Perilla frutescens var. hirtella]|nr:hypothetical protein C2S52_014048 [Perilla frutescens var. hirtella]